MSCNPGHWPWLLRCELGGTLLGGAVMVVNYWVIMMVVVVIVVVIASVVRCWASETTRRPSTTSHTHG